MSSLRLISRATARRFLVTRHLLAPPRALPADPSSVLCVVERLGSLQFDPLEVAGRNHDLVLLARIAGYRRVWTDDLLYRERALYETYNKGLSLVPTAELPWYRITWDLNLEEHEARTFREHAALAAELLERIRDDGPLSSTDVAPRAAIDWYWRPTNPVRALLEALAEAGILGLARRDGNRRVYDLVERLFPAELLAVRLATEEQRRHKLLSRYRAHGLLGSTGQAELWIGTARTAGERRRLQAELVEAGKIIPLNVEGIRGERHVLDAELALLDDAEAGVAAGLEATPGVAFVAPLDPLVWDRALLRTLFDFDYLWEVYVPAARRRWGYYVLPILYGDRFVGRIEPRIDRAGNRLTVRGLWWEDAFDPLADHAFVPAFAAALDAHREFGALRRIVLPRSRRHQAFVAAVRAALD